MSEKPLLAAPPLTLLDKWRWLGVVVATPDLPAAALAAAHVLADYCGKSGLAYPAYGTIADRIVRSRRSAMRGVAALERAGLVEAAEGGRRGTRAWRLSMAATLEGPDGATTAGNAMSAPPLRQHQSSGGAVAQRCQERHEGVTAMAHRGDTDVIPPVTRMAQTGATAVTRSPFNLRMEFRQELHAEKLKGSASTPSVASQPHPSAVAAGWGCGAAGAPVAAATHGDKNRQAAALAMRLAAMVPAAKTNGGDLVAAAHDALVVVSADRVIAAYGEHLAGTPPQFVERPDRFLARAGWKRPITHREPRRPAAGGAAGGGR
jgi:hypothetical protein